MSPDDEDDDDVAFGNEQADNAELLFGTT